MRTFSTAICITLAAITIMVLSRSSDRREGVSPADIRRTQQDPDEANANELDRVPSEQGRTASAGNGEDEPARVETPTDPSPDDRIETAHQGLDALPVDAAIERLAELKAKKKTQVKALIASRSQLEHLRVDCSSPGDFPEQHEELFTIVGGNTPHYHYYAILRVDAPELFALRDSIRSIESRDDVQHELAVRAALGSEQ